MPAAFGNPVSTSLQLTCFVDAERPARDTPEAEQPIFVYRLLKKKEVNKDLVHQEVQTYDLKVMQC